MLWHPAGWRPAESQQNERPHPIQATGPPADRADVPRLGPASARAVGPDAEVLAPDELRQALARKAAKTATLYAADANS